MAEPIDPLRAFAPNLARLTVEFAYSDVARPTLNLKARQMCEVAMPAALGTAAAPLRYHVSGARAADLTDQAGKETPTMMTDITNVSDVLTQAPELPRPAELTLDPSLSFEQAAPTVQAAQGFYGFWANGDQSLLARDR